jgi:hypothetical protein
MRGLGDELHLKLRTYFMRDNYWLGRKFDFNFKLFAHFGEKRRNQSSTQAREGKKESRISMWVPGVGQKKLNTATYCYRELTES